MNEMGYPDVCQVVLNQDGYGCMVKAIVRPGLLFSQDPELSLYLLRYNEISSGLIDGCLDRITNLFEQGIHARSRR